MKTNARLDENPIIVGCNYHTKWQSSKRMRFVLSEVKGDQARLTTRKTKKDFWTKTSDLIFIKSGHNFRKALEVLKQTQQ